MSQVVDIDSSQLLRGIGSDEPPAQVGPYNVALDDDRFSRTQHSTDFSSTFLDLDRIVETFSESVLFSRKIRRRINGSNGKHSAVILVAYLLKIRQNFYHVIQFSLSVFIK